MASAVVGSLRVILGMDTAEFELGTKKADQALKNWSKDFKSIGQQATQIGGQLTAALTVPIVGAFAASAKATMDFESSFANVRKTVDATTPELDALAMTFRKMAKEIPLTTDELNEIAALGGQMGVPIANMEKFVRHVAALGVAVDGISTEEAAAGLAQIGNIAGTGTVKIAEMASTLVHLGNSSNATEGDILEFTKRLMGAGHAVNMTVPEVMALGTSMANVGINAEAGGTAMSTMIAKMSMAVSEGGTALKNFDIIVAHTGKSFTELWQDSPVQAINAVVVGLGKAKDSGADLNLVVKDIGATNIRTADTMKRLAGAGDGVATSLKTSNEGWIDGNKHITEAEKKYATTANQLKLLWSAVKDVGITLGNALLPAIQQAVKWAGQLVPVVEMLVKGVTALPAPVQLAGVAFLGLLAAAGPVLLLVGQVAFAMSSLTAAFATGGIAATGMATATGLLSTALGFLGPAVAVVAAAMAGWQIGKYIGELTGLTGVVQNLTEKIMGYRDASEPLESQQKLINQAIKLGADQSVTYAEAMAFLQKRSADLRAAHVQTTEAVKEQGKQTAITTISTKDAAKATKDKEEADKKAKKAAEEHAAAIKAQEQALSALGLVTEKEVNEKIVELTKLQDLATKAGVPLVSSLKAQETVLKALAAKAKESGVEFKHLTEYIAYLDAQIRALSPTPQALSVKMGLPAVITGLQEVQLSTLGAIRTGSMLEDAYKALGITSQKSLKDQAEAARRAYADILASGIATSEELKEARQAVLDKEIAAGERTISLWEGEIKPAIEGVISGLSDSLARGLTDMIGHWNRAGDIMKEIWQGVKNAFLNVLEEMLSNFINGFLKGLLNGIASAKLGQALATSLFGGGAGGAGGGLIPGVGGGGSGAGTGGFPGGTALGQVGTTFSVFDLLFDLMGTDKGLLEGMYDNITDPFGESDPGHQAEMALQNFLAGAAYLGLTPEEHAANLGIDIPTGLLPSFAGGTNGQYLDFGAGTLAMLHGREKITPQGAEVEGGGWGNGGVTVILEQDGVKTAQWFAPYLVDEVLRLRLA